jgi:hypothetical protein
VAVEEVSALVVEAVAELVVEAVVALVVDSAARLQLRLAARYLRCQGRRSERCCEAEGVAATVVVDELESGRLWLSVDEVWSSAIREGGVATALAIDEAARLTLRSVLAAAMRLARILKKP